MRSSSPAPDLPPRIDAARAIALRNNIAALHLVACRMSHERVRWDGPTIVRLQIEGSADMVARVPLCRPDIRSQRLACGHTNVRNELSRTLRALQGSGALCEAVVDQLDQELRSIGHDIQLLDHRKGDAERDAALADAAAPWIANAARSCRERHPTVLALESEHDRHVERLRDWRDRLLRAVDEALASR